MRGSIRQVLTCTILQLLLSFAGVHAVDPISFGASENWDGDDGPWSSFSLRLGNPQQVVRALPSTQGYNTIAALPSACIDNTDYNKCVESRGGIFSPKDSKTWQGQDSLYGAGMQSNLGYSTVIAEFGVDKIGLGIINNENLTFADQIIGGINDTAFYVGSFGIGTQPTNFSNFASPHTSFFTTLWDKGVIPSYTWSYTAGATYKFTKVLGSLVFGGYDSARIYDGDASKRVVVHMAQDVSRDLLVRVQSITASYATGSKLLLPTAHFSFIDSTLPYIWLPKDSCTLFESTLGLVWNSTYEMYLINDTLHTSLTKLNPNFIFTIGSGKAGGDSVDITLPYSAMAQQATVPLLPFSSLYFPLKRADNDTQFTLGRAFLQEAMLIVDYERSNFTVAAINWVEGTPKKVVKIESIAGAAAAAAAVNSSSSSNSTAGAGNKSDSKSSVSTGAIAGIAIVGALFLILGGVVFWLRKKKKWPFATKRVELDGSVHPVEVGHGANDVEISAYSATEPKPNTVEAMSSPLAEMDDMQPLAGFYGKQTHPRHEMADATPVGSELASPDSHRLGVHEMFDESVYHEMHSTTSSQVRESPSSRNIGSVAQPFSWMQTPVSAVSGPVLPSYNDRVPLPGSGTRTQEQSWDSSHGSYRSDDSNNSRTRMADDYPQDRKHHHGD